MTTGAISANAQAQVQQQAGMAVLGKAMDAAKTQGSQVAQMLQQPVQQQVQDPALGNAVNILA